MCCCSTVAGGVHLIMLITSFALLVVLKGISNGGVLNKDN